jgi:hypothetical protein
MVLYAYVLCLRILASLRIPRYDIGRRTHHLDVVLSQLVIRARLVLNTH